MSIDRARTHKKPAAIKPHRRPGHHDQARIHPSINAGQAEQLITMPNRGASAALRQATILQLQQTHGNAYVQRVIQEARSRTASLQRCGPKACNCGPEERARHALEEENETHDSVPDVAGEIQRSVGRGRKLNPMAQAFLQPAMGLDLGNLTIHDDAHADRLSRAVDAEAFTSGSDIYFRSGRYDPNSQRGLHLLAHEITHAAQQSEGSVSGVQSFDGVRINEPGDRFEQDAEQNANRVMSQLHSPTKEFTRTVLTETAARPSRSLQRRPSTSQAPMIQRKVFVDKSSPGWTVQFNPSATVVPNVGAKPTTHYDFDSTTSKFHHDTYDVKPESSGAIFIGVNMTWHRVGGGGGNLPGLPPGVTPELFKKICDPCNKLPPILPDEFHEKCQKEKTFEAKRQFIKNLIFQFKADPCSFIENAFLSGLCTVGTFIPVVSNIIDGIGKGLIAANNAIDAIMKNPLCSKLPGGIPEKTVDKGKGNATLKLSYQADSEGKVQVFGPAPISQSHGTGASVVTPVQFTKETTPIGAEVSLAPMIHSNISRTNPNGETIAEVNNFQQVFSLTAKPPGPTEPVTICCADSVFPFVVNSDKLEKENQEIADLFDWYSSLDPVVKEKVEAGEIPISITGRASSTGGSAHNLTLSEKRVKKAERFMRDFAGSDAHIITFAVGKETVKKTGEVGEERRADIKIEGKLKGAAAGKLSGPPCGTNAPTEFEDDLCKETPTQAPPIGTEESDLLGTIEENVPIGNGSPFEELPAESFAEVGFGDGFENGSGLFSDFEF